LGTCLIYGSAISSF